MSQVFENIFEKYSISCDIPKKRSKKCRKTAKQIYKYKTKQNVCLNKRVAENRKRVYENAPNKKHFCHELKKPKQIGLKESLPSAENNVTLSNKTGGSFYYGNKSTKTTKDAVVRYKPLDLITLTQSNPGLNISTREYTPSKHITLSGDTKNNSDIAISCGEARQTNTTASGNLSERNLSFNESFNSNHSKSQINESNNSTSSNLGFNNTYEKNKNALMLSSFNLKKKSARNNNRSTKASRLKPLNVTITQRVNKSFSSTSFEKPSDLTSTFEITSCHLKNSLSSFPNDTFSNKHNNFSNCSPQLSQIIDNPTQSQESVNELTELDLLLELIEQDEKKKKQKLNESKCHDISSPTKPCLRGGYEELFERALKRHKVGNRFLRHDKKFGLKNGVLLRVLNIETSYGLTVATVKHEDNNRNFYIVIAPEMVSKIKLDTQIEAFFDDTAVPYKLKRDEDYLDIYLEPYKLLVG